MGKRSDFERVPRDFYPTPFDAAKPLFGHLPAEFRFVEPCYGDGALSRHMMTAGGICSYASDIEPRADHCERRDFTELSELDVYDAEYIITNPPWDRKILHPMIRHFSSLRPTWLLFDADWMHTKQSAEFMPLLLKIVSVGRVKWIPDSKMTGKDNCCWYLFDKAMGRGVEFVGRG